MGYEHGTARLASYTNSSSVIVAEVAKLYQRIKDPSIPIKRVNLSFNNIVEDEFRQMSLFSDIDEEIKEVKMQKAVISLKEKYGSNAVLKGMNLEEGGKTIERNNQIGGHRR